jgi:hypothetical protein
MLVIIKNVPIELPDLEAELLLHRGIAHLPELADLPIPTRFESSGTRTPRSRQPDMALKQRKSSKGSSKKKMK